MKIMKRFLYAAAVLLALSMLLMLITYIITPSSAGKELSKKKGLKWPMVIAHRGASYLAPELTVPSFTLAMEIGVDYVETDIQRTRDGILVNLHDHKNLKRTTNIEEVFPQRAGDPPGSFTYNELKRLDAGSWFNKKYPERAMGKYAGLTIPTFEEYIDAAVSGKNRPGLMIELKKPGKYPGIEKQLIDILVEKGWLDSSNNGPVEKIGKNSNGYVRVGFGRHRVILQSFDGKSLEIVKSIAPDVLRIFLMNKKAVKEHGTFSKMLDISERIGADIGPSGYLALPWNIGAVHRRSKNVFVYTLDNDFQFTPFYFLWC